jgi:hypothetical protein
MRSGVLLREVQGREVAITIDSKWFEVDLAIVVPRLHYGIGFQGAFE